MGDAWLDELVTLEQFMSTKAKATNDILKSRRDWLSIFAQYADSSGGIQTLLNSSGQITESIASANLPNISTYTSASNDTERYGLVAYFTASPSTSANKAGGQHIILSPTVSATAGGSIASTSLVNAAAGFYPCMRITGIWSDMTDPSVALALAPSAGAFTYGPAAWTIATTANTLNNYNTGLVWKGNTANTSIDVSAAAGQAQANQLFIFIGEYWYEAL